MRQYEKPLILIMEDTSEGIYADSGQKQECRFNKKHFQPNSAGCTVCAYSGGQYSKPNQLPPGVSFNTLGDATYCVDNMPG